MSPHILLQRCSAAGVSVHLIGGAIKLRGTAEAVKSVADEVRSHKPQLLALLTTSTPANMVDEFMEADGLTRAEAEAMARVSVQPRTPEVWIAMIDELNSLITAFCASAQVSDETKARICSAAAAQSLASIPDTIRWFRAQLRTLQPRQPLNETQGPV